MFDSLREAIGRADERYVRWMTGTSAPVEERTSYSDWGTWAGDAPTATTPEGALKLLAVSGSVQLLTESIATLPTDVFRETPSGRVSIAKPAWLRQPVVGLSFIDWCTQVLTSLLLHGNAYIVVTRDSGGRIVELVPVDPREVTVDRGGSMGGRRRFIVKGQPFQGEMVHIPGMMLAGHDMGLSPLEFARVSIEGGLAAQQFGVDSFNGGLKMPGVIEFPGAVDPTKMGETARLWQRARRKGGHGLPGVLEGGGTFKPIGITNEAAQFLQTRQWTAAEICAQVYLVDPRELGIPLTGSTLEYVNSESRLANLVRKGMLRWITRLEGALSALLPSPQYLKFNVDAFKRADSGDRWTTYEIASRINAAAVAIGQKPVLLTDEMRAWEELDPLPDVEPMAVDAEDDTEDDVEDDESVDAMRAVLASVAELRAAVDRPVAPSAPPVVNITNTPPQVTVEPAVVHVAPADVRVDARQDAPVVNYTPPDVVVNVNPTPVEVTNEITVPPALVNVEVPRTKHTVKRDAQGNIVEVVEEPAP